MNWFVIVAALLGTFCLCTLQATMTIKATGAVTASVANTAKRVIVLLYMAAVTGAI